MTLGFLLIFGLFTLAYIAIVFCRSATIRLQDEHSSFERRDVGKAMQSLPGHVELNLAHAPRDVSADKYFMVEIWSDADNMR